MGGLEDMEMVILYVHVPDTQIYIYISFHFCIYYIFMNLEHGHTTRKIKPDRIITQELANEGKSLTLMGPSKCFQPRAPSPSTLCMLLDSTNFPPKRPS